MNISFVEPITSKEACNILGIDQSQYILKLKSGGLRATGSIRAYVQCSEPFHTIWDLSSYYAKVELTTMGFSLGDVAEDVESVLDVVDYFLEVNECLPTEKQIIAACSGLELGKNTCKSQGLKKHGELNSKIVIDIALRSVISVIDSFTSVVNLLQKSSDGQFSISLCQTDPDDFCGG